MAKKANLGHRVGATRFAHSRERSEFLALVDKLEKLHEDTKVLLERLYADNLALFNTLRRELPAGGFAYNLRWLRKHAGLSQQQLANEAGVDKKRVHRHEHGGGCRSDMVKKYADTFTRVLNKPISVADLLRDVESVI